MWVVGFIVGLVSFCFNVSMYVLMSNFPYPIVILIKLEL